MNSIPRQINSNSSEVAISKLGDAILMSAINVQEVNFHIDSQTLKANPCVDSVDAKVIVLRNRENLDKAVFEKSVCSSDIPKFLYLPEYDEISELVGLRSGVLDVLHGGMSAIVISERITAALSRHNTNKHETNEYEEIRATGTPPPIFVNLERKEFSFYDQRVKMTGAEIRILDVLLRRQGHSVSREELAAMFKAEGKKIQHRVVDGHIKRIRAKLAEKDISREIIQTNFGVGYMFSSPDVA